MEENSSGFYAMMSRMKYIERWALMHNVRKETISEHAMEVSMLAHALAVIGNTRLGKNYNEEKTVLIGLYHDASEIITGDMPTPIKYYNEEMRDLFHGIEDRACDRMVDMLPEDMRASYRKIFFPTDEDKDIWRLVKAADKLSAFIKCLEELGCGNTEFRSAKESTLIKLKEMREELPELKIFMKEFLPAYGKTLDELQEK